MKTRMNLLIPSHEITAVQAQAIEASRWWEGQPASVVALSQVKQPRACMPRVLFREACKTFVAEILADRAFTSQSTLVALLQRRTG